MYIYIGVAIGSFLKTYSIFIFGLWKTILKLKLTLPVAADDLRCAHYTAASGAYTRSLKSLRNSTGYAASRAAVFFPAPLLILSHISVFMLVYFVLNWDY